MAVMIFKRGVFESRRKNKAIFRPKIRINLRDVQTVSLRMSSLFQTPFLAYVRYTSVPFKPWHWVLVNPVPYSLHQWQREKRMPSQFEHHLTSSLSQSFCPIAQSQLCNLEGPEVAEKPGKVLAHRPWSDSWRPLFRRSVLVEKSLRVKRR